MKFKTEDETLEIGMIGGAVFLAYPEEAEITGNVFNKNKASMYAGGLMFTTDDIESFISDNLKVSKLLKKFIKY